MTEDANLPFQTFAFTLAENKRPRKAFRMTAREDGLYELSVQQGSAANPSAQFTRTVPLEAAERLRDVLQAIGAFGWDDSYGDTFAPGTRRWSMNVVFREGVFSLESRGGSDAPNGFDDLLEELYRMDFPRPASRNAAGSTVRMPSSAGDAAAFASQFGMEGVDAAEMQRMLAEAAGNPEVLASRMKDEFRRMSPAEQNEMLDALAATGLATRAWWERFFRS